MGQPSPVPIEKIVAARQNYFEHGRVIDGAIDPAIYRSWTRCVETEKRATQRVEFDLLGPSRVSELVQRNQVLLDAASEPLEDLEKAVAGAGYAVLLTDSRGFSISVGGALAKQHADIQSAFRKGVDLSEDAIGTSAMACALYERRPVKVFGPEHFFSGYELFHCAAAPIIDPRGHLIGTVDITRGSPHPDFGALSLVTRCAHAIEYELFRRIPATVTIALSWQPQSFEPYSDLIFLFGQDGEILGENEIARHFVGGDVCRANLGFEDIFDVRFGDTVTALQSARGPIPLRLRSGISMFASIWGRERPSSQLISSGRNSKPAELAKTCTNLISRVESLEFGDSRIGQQLELARRAFEGGLPLLVLGETGTGKDVIARAMHERSSRCDAPFVAVNCAAIPESLIESELFGYEDGAFTGAKRGGIAGKIEQANFGTLFLDEIGDMPIHLQARLLRVLENREVTRLAGHSARKVDFQLICATHQNIEQAVADGRFRMDLYYRVNGFSMRLLPLRERKNIKELAQSVIQDISDGQRSLSSEVLYELEKHRWPGNVRELKHVLTYANAIAPLGSEIHIEHLPDWSPSHVASPKLQSERGALGMLGHLEQQAIRKALEEASGNVGVAAKILGISRATLYRRLKAESIT